MALLARPGAASRATRAPRPAVRPRLVRPRTLAGAAAEEAVLQQQQQQHTAAGPPSATSAASQNSAVPATRELQARMAAASMMR
jgi:hypothetical protein